MWDALRAENWAPKKRSIISTRLRRRVGGRRMNRRERKEGETVAIKLCRIRYIVQLCFPHPAAGPVVNVTNADDIFRYIIATIFLSMIKQRKLDYLFDQYGIRFYIEFVIQGLNLFRSKTNKRQMFNLRYTD